MKRKLIFGLSLLLGATAIAQDQLPTNAEPGKCYVRCTTPDVWKNETVSVQTAAAYKILKSHGPQYTTEKVTLETKAASSRLEVIPAQYENKNVTVVVQEATSRLEIVPGKTTPVKETMIIQDATSRLEVVPAQYETRYVDVVVQPASTRLEVVPAQYETRKETMVIQPATTRLEVVPAEWTTQTLSYNKGVRVSTLKVAPAEFANSTQTIITKPATAKWVMGDKAPDCEDTDPNACRVWCYRNIPEQSVVVSTRNLAKSASVVTVPCNGAEGNGDCIETATYTKRVLAKPATTREITIPARTKEITKTVMVKPATTRAITVPAITKKVKTTVMVKPATTRSIPIAARTKEITKTVVTPPTAREITIPSRSTTVKTTVMVKPATTKSIAVPAQHKTFTKTVLAKAAWTTETEVPAQHQTVTKEILVTKGGLKSWREIDCKLQENTLLPINWNLGSATLTNSAKAIIDSKLMPILNNGISIALSSHTDSRGSDSSNQRLSERRANAVVNYLISKGVNRSQLTGKGYGETRLTNRCANGVTCTEAEHRANRRTTFRVLSK